MHVVCLFAFVVNSIMKMYLNKNYEYRINTGYYRKLK